MPKRRDEEADRSMTQAEADEYWNIHLLNRVDELPARKVWYPTLDASHMAERMVKEGLLKKHGTKGYCMTPKGERYLEKARAAGHRRAGEPKGRAKSRASAPAPRARS